jgi:hypothetical protein
MSPNFCSCPQPRPKMVINSFGNRNFMQSMRRLSSACIRDGPCFSFWVWGGGRFFLFFFCFPSFFLMCSQHVLIMFLWGSQVPKLFPEAFPTAPQFYPIWFAQSWTLMYITWKGTLLMNAFIFILQLGSKERGASIVECLMFQKNCSWANEYGSFQKK